MSDYPRPKKAKGGINVTSSHLISNVYSGYLHSPGSHQSSHFISICDSVTHVGSIESHDAKKDCGKSA